MSLSETSYHVEHHRSTEEYFFRVSIFLPGFLVPAWVQDRPPAELDEDVAEGGVADRSYPPLKRGRWEAGEI